MIIVPTNDIPLMIDTAFAELVNPCEDLVLQTSGLVHEVYSEERKRDVLYLPDLEQEWSPDTSAAYQTVHLVANGTKDTFEQFGTFEEGTFSVRCIMGIIHYGNTMAYLETIRAIESVEGVSVVSFDLRPMSVLRNVFKMKPDDNFNLPSTLTAWSVTYEMKNVGFYSNEQGF